MYASSTCYKKPYKCNFISCLTTLSVFLMVICVNFALFANTKTLNNFVSAEGVEGDVVEKIEESTNEIFDKIDFSELDEICNNKYFNNCFFEGESFKELVNRVLDGDEIFDLKDVSLYVSQAVKINLNKILRPLIYIILIVIICCLFKEFKPSKISGVSDIIYFVCCSIIVVILSKLIFDISSEVKECIINLKKQMGLIFPILLTLVSSMGGAQTALSFTPFVTFLSNVISDVFIYILFPLFTLNLVLSIIGNLSKASRMDKLNKFTKQLFKWIVGIVVSIFIACLTIKTFVSGAKDGISIKAAKYAVKNYIPILGGYINSGLEVVKAGSLLVKNATGVVSLIYLLLSVVSPILLIAVMELLLKLVSGIIEVVGDKQSSNLVYSVSNSLRLLVVIMVSVALMYFITIYSLMSIMVGFG